MSAKSGGDLATGRYALVLGAAGAASIGLLVWASARVLGVAFVEDPSVSAPVSTTASAIAGALALAWLLAAPAARLAMRYRPERWRRASLGCLAVALAAAAAIALAFPGAAQSLPPAAGVLLTVCALFFGLTRPHDAASGRASAILVMTMAFGAVAALSVWLTMDLLIGGVLEAGDVALAPPPGGVAIEPSLFATHHPVFMALGHVSLGWFAVIWGAGGLVLASVHERLWKR